MRQSIAAWLHRLAANELEVLRASTLDEGTVALFAKSFTSAPPSSGLHFVARLTRPSKVLGYVHYTNQAAGVFLCGGLCVDTSAYRVLRPKARTFLRQAGSLSRWLLSESIHQLPEKNAVFAYTGNTVSRRDCLAIGFRETEFPYLLVQWHSPPSDKLLRQIASLGPF